MTENILQEGTLRYLDMPKAVIIAALIIAFGLTLSGRYTVVQSPLSNVVWRVDGLTGAIGMCGTITTTTGTKSGCLPVATARLTP